MLKVEIIGNIGNDTEIKEFGGKKYVSFSVAHTEYQKDEQGIEQATCKCVHIASSGMEIKFNKTPF